MTIRIRYRILNARLAAGAVSAGQGGGVDQAYDGWRVVSQFEFQQWGGKRSFAQAARMTPVRKCPTSRWRIGRSRAESHGRLHHGLRGADVLLFEY